MNVGVVGSMSFHDRKLMWEILDAIGEFVLVSGGALGADLLAEEYVDEHEFNKVVHYPDWILYGKSAGMIRNKLIVRDSDMIIAFWDGESGETLNTIQLGYSKGIPVEVFKY